MPFCASFITHVRSRYVHLLQNLAEKLPSLHEPEVHYLKAYFVLCYSFLIIYVRMKKFAMFQQSYMKVFKMADNLGVSVLLVKHVFSGCFNINLCIFHETAKSCLFLYKDKL